MSPLTAVPSSASLSSACESEQDLFTSASANTAVVEADGIPRDRIPQDRHEADQAGQAEKALVEELERLSIGEREKILLDIYGVAERSIDGVAVDTKLQEMRRELALLTENKEAYDRALHLNRAYVENDAFQLMFLRAQEFDAVKAAKLLVLHFEVKRELFVREDGNDDVLARDVTWADLDEHDQITVLSGIIQVGAKRDIAGRTLLFFATSKVPERMDRAFYYMLMSSLLTDSEMLMKGVVLVLINFRGTFLPRNALRQVIRIYSSLPLKVAAVHYGYQHAYLYPAVVGFRLIMYAFSARDSFRFRIHYGNLEKIAFELQTFGIPMEISPVRTLNGTDTVGLSAEWHREWLQSIQVLEQRKRALQPGSADEIVCVLPRRSDVLLGKTKEARDHTGTLRCHNLVRSHSTVYEQASRRAKTKVAEQVLTIIAEAEGRFLKWEKASGSSGYWVGVPHAVARDKISHMFRHLREERAKAETNDATTVSSHESSVGMSSSQRNKKGLDGSESSQPSAKQQRTAI